jgi:solute carrier family 25 phosphate transporter 23/24/25/41
LIQGAEKYNGMTDAFRKIYASEGWKGFYRGLLPNYLKVVPAISISFLVFEQLRAAMNIQRSSH